jgi:hypothetical protein
VGGKPGYMAPEIVCGKAKPSERSDCHSLAVVLFKLFFRDNPLQGAEFEKIPCLTEKHEMELFGTKSQGGVPIGVGVSVTFSEISGVIEEKTT